MTNAGVVTAVDIRGALVEARVDSRQSSGRHEVQFNLDYLPGGAYFYQVWNSFAISYNAVEPLNRRGAMKPHPAPVRTVYRKLFANNCTFLYFKCAKKPIHKVNNRLLIINHL